MSFARRLSVAVLAMAAGGFSPATAADLRVQTIYRELRGMREDCLDLRRHGVDVVEFGCKGVEPCRKMIEAARNAGLKLSTGILDITEHASAVKSLGLDPEYAVMIGGCYRGKAIDRHLFSFSAARQSLVIEPPVNHPGFPYKIGTTGMDGKIGKEPMGHYYPGVEPIRAEVVVPLKRFDGQQHLRILPATITPATKGEMLEVDSVGDSTFRKTAEFRKRQLYCLEFDLSGLDEACLNQVGIAVFWVMKEPPAGYEGFGGGMVSAASPSSRLALEKEVDRRIAMWCEANGGVCPSDMLTSFRYGDESFHRTGQTQDNSASSYPLWDFSPSGLAAFRRIAPEGLEYPRTWGHPEIYGAEAYGLWQYAYHRSCAELVRVVRKSLDRFAMGVPLFRNTTRNAVFFLSNDHDGCGQELLAKELSWVHLDPYPAGPVYQEDRIAMDMGYCSGFSRRFGKPLIPWLQAHVYGDLRHPTPSLIRRMYNENRVHGIDGLIWLGYGSAPYTFPAANAESWEEAAKIHSELHAQLPEKPKARLAVLRPYSVWALSNNENGSLLRNPADWLLQQFLMAWSCDRHLAYDVFELPPLAVMKDEELLCEELSHYEFVVSTIPRKGVTKLIGAGSEGSVVNLNSSKAVRAQFNREITEMLREL